ncbi:MAG: GspK family T2SS minor pseudopilin variant XcpX [Gammaproteobacteria bacterium]|nr:MAG: GspK family T2SS minor pseudopilin variant XcpX [Gammaproteobacteria bacterium]
MLIFLQRRGSFYRQERGIALLLVLLVVALASIASASLASRQYLEIRRTTNVIRANEAYFMVLGAEQWARQILRRDLKDTRTDSLQDAWAGDLSNIKLQRGQLNGRIVDLQGRYNLNNLVKKNTGDSDSNEIKRFMRLLEALSIDTSLAQAVVDWIDAGINPLLPAGAEDQEYLGLDTPYRTANRPMANITELLLIKGFNEEIFRQLSPHITALPVYTEVNINTASVPVIMAMIAGIGESGAEDIVAQRELQAFNDVSELRNMQALEGRTIIGINVKSEFFMSEFEMKLDGVVTVLTSILYRPVSQTGKTVISVLGRTQGYAQ